MAAGQNRRNDGIHQVQNPCKAEDHSHEAAHKADHPLGCLGALPGGPGGEVAHAGIGRLHVVLQKRRHLRLVSVLHIKGVFVDRRGVVQRLVNAGGEV